MQHRRRHGLYVGDAGAKYPGAIFSTHEPLLQDLSYEHYCGCKVDRGTALEGAKNVAGNVAKRTTGFWGGVAGWVEKSLGWEVTVAMLPVAIEALGEECKCSKFQ